MSIFYFIEVGVKRNHQKFHTLKCRLASAGVGGLEFRSKLKYKAKSVS